MSARVRRKKVVELRDCQLARPELMWALREVIGWMNVMPQDVHLQVAPSTLQHMLTTSELQDYLWTQRRLGYIEPGKLPAHLYGIKVVANEEHPPGEFDLYNPETNDRVTVKLGY